MHTSQHMFVSELVTASPLLYSTLKLMEQWELTFTRRLEALGPAPDDLFGDEEEAESPMFRNGPPIMRHKSILEQDHTPFNRWPSTIMICTCHDDIDLIHWRMRHLVSTCTCTCTCSVYMYYYVFHNISQGEGYNSKWQFWWCIRNQCNNAHLMFAGL